ncbi:MAG: hypothetical protein WC233_03615 [Sphaerochaeta sp.]
MKRVKLEAALIDVMGMDPTEFESSRYFLFRQASYIIKHINAPMTRSVSALRASDQVVKLPETHIKTYKVIPGNPLNLSEDRVYPFMHYRELLDRVSSVAFSDQGDNLVLTRTEHIVTMVYDSMLHDEFGEPETLDIFLPAITSYILWRKVKQKKFKAAMTSDQAYYILRDQESALKKEYETYIVNARAEMRLVESEMKNNHNLIWRPDDYHEYTQ